MKNPLSFAGEHRKYIRAARDGQEFGFSLKTVAKIAPVLSFLYDEWWRVEFMGDKHLPAEGPVLIVGNAGGVLPWAGLMLMYALMNMSKPRRLTIMANLDWIEDERLYNFLREIGFVCWSADNARRLFAAGQTVVAFPEGVAGAVKPFGERYRLRSFDWTTLMPAVDMNVSIMPFAALGPDESFPVGLNLEPLAKLLSLPAFPITPAFPWLPFPVNFFSLPVRWKLRLLKPVEYERTHSREEVEERAKSLALFLEGEVQAELNRLLRTRIKALF